MLARAGLSRGGARLRRARADGRRHRAELIRAGRTPTAASTTTAPASTPACWPPPRIWASRPRAIGAPSIRCRSASGACSRTWPAPKLERRRARHRRLLGAELGDTAGRPRACLCAAGDRRTAWRRSARADADNRRSLPGRTPSWSPVPGRLDTRVMQRLPRPGARQGRRRGRLLRRLARERPRLRPQDRRRRQARCRAPSSTRSSPGSIPHARTSAPSAITNWRGLEVGQVRILPRWPRCCASALSAKPISRCFPRNSAKLAGRQARHVLPVNTMATWVKCTTTDGPKFALNLEHVAMIRPQRARLLGERVTSPPARPGPLVEPRHPAQPADGRRDG